MSQNLFCGWLVVFDGDMASKHRNVLLLMENTVHNVSPAVKVMKIAFLPPNIVSKLESLKNTHRRYFEIHKDDLLMEEFF